MPNTKYYYDPKSASYIKLKTTKVNKIIRSVVFILASLFFGFIIFLISTNFVKSPKELSSNRELENMKFQYDILTKKMKEISSVMEDIKTRDNNIYRAYFGAKPISNEIRKAGFGGVNRYEYLEGYDNSELMKLTTKKIDILAKQLAIQSKSFDQLIKKAKSKDKMLASIPAIQPISRKKLTRVASGYGMRLHPILKIFRMHAGMDFTAKTGTAIHATGNGRVERAERSKSYGNVVTINHGYGYKTNYAHMSRFVVRSGSRVKRGDVIGYVGNTGLSSGPHLHYEVMKNGNKVNPAMFYYKDLGPDEYSKMLEEANQHNPSLD